MALSFEVEARRPVGRPKKVWRKLVEENDIEHYRRDGYGQASYPVQPHDS